jgi:CII-binding regulator of phage lambda lysogenization HflD
VSNGVVPQNSKNLERILKIKPSLRTSNYETTRRIPLAFYASPLAQKSNYLTTLSKKLKICNKEINHLEKKTDSLLAEKLNFKNSDLIKQSLDKKVVIKGSLCTLDKSSFQTIKQKKSNFYFY